MTTLTTHDTKRGEDVRARIDVLSEVPEEWADVLARRRAALRLGDGALENLLWQSIVGSWPRERDALQAYAEKAASEAGGATTWTDPDEPFEERLHALIDAAFDDDEVRADIDAVRRAHRGSRAGRTPSRRSCCSSPVPACPTSTRAASCGSSRSSTRTTAAPVDFAERRARCSRELDAGRAAARSTRRARRSCS